MVLFLHNDREITTARLWTVRAVLFIILVSSLSRSLATTISIAEQLGAITGIAIIYWAALFLLSTEIDETELDDEPVDVRDIDLQPHLDDHEPGDIVLDTELSNTVGIDAEVARSLLADVDTVEPADNTGRRWRVEK